MNITANWIWSSADNGRTYNSHMIFRRDFRLESVPENARIAVSADSSYRLKVNGQWCADGPARSYPEKYSYDIIDASTLLKSGLNRIECDVRFFACGTFHQIPQRGGFIFQLEADGETILISDDSWDVADMPQWIKNTAKSSPQMAPLELFDASANQTPEWKKSSIICGANEGPWKNLTPRETPMLTREEMLIKKVISCRTVNKDLKTVAIYPHRLLYPDVYSINNQDVVPILVAIEVTAEKACKSVVCGINMVCTVNGAGCDENGLFQFRKGTNTVICGTRVFCGHDANFAAAFPGDGTMTINNVYCHILKDLASLTSDVPYFPWANREHLEREKAYFEQRDAALKLKGIEDFISAYPEAKLLTDDELLYASGAVSVLNTTYQNIKPNCENINNIIYPDDRDAVIHPVENCDVEILCDLGSQSVGYWNFMLFADEGTIVDISGVEYITPDGIIQSTEERYNNTVRYICRQGANRFTSYVRRGGRFIIITLRNIKNPVRFRSFRMVESTYPMVFTGYFHSSDRRLDRIYDISARTLKLCTEDTFTDCPLYEQTFWVGDARNEGIFAMNSCGAYDMVRHCIRLAAESMNCLPYIGCQVPSSWSVHIPAFGFMWLMSIEDYYNETADEAFVKEMFPCVKELLERSENLCRNKFGIMRTTDWNFLDWSNMDTMHPYMLYNTFLFVGGLRSASRMAEYIGDKQYAESCSKRAEQLTDILAEYWNERHQAFVESMDDDGKMSEVYSMHTSLFALLFDAARENIYSSVKTNILGDRNDLITAGSPFFTYYLHDLYGKLGAFEQSYEKVKSDYLNMLKFDATTVWETFAEGNYDHTWEKSEIFPTRSHCHAWSSIPLELFPRVLLGIRRESIGCRSFVISPYIADLDFASGARYTPHGNVDVSWCLDKEQNKLLITCRHPEEIVCRFEHNVSTSALDVEFKDITL